VQPYEIGDCAGARRVSTAVQDSQLERQAIVQAAVWSGRSNMNGEIEMKTPRNVLYGLNPFLLSSIASALTAAQVVLAVFLHGSAPAAFRWAGWICLWTSGVFGILPIIAFRRRGGVPKGKSYMKTTVLVDTGIYAIVRHPQGGTAWLLLNLGIMLIAWHWSSVVLGLASMGLAYADTFKADQYCIEKFGTAYRRYMERVPRTNFVSGIVRLVRPRGGEAGQR
jgi:protein-S-isoprenylcysteine O-methyltransferase Ste14